MIVSTSLRDVLNTAAEECSSFLLQGVKIFSVALIYLAALFLYLNDSVEIYDEYKPVLEEELIFPLTNQCVSSFEEFSHCLNTNHRSSLPHTGKASDIVAKPLGFHNCGHLNF